MTTVIVSGAVANKCFSGGAAWNPLSYVFGLKALGFDVWLVEQIRRETCVDAAGGPAAFEDSLNRTYFQRVVERFGLSGCAALVYEQGERTCGLPYAELCDVAGAAALLVNLGGHLTLEALKQPPRRKVYIDEDPGFTQLWDAAGTGGFRLDGHDLYYTVGENIGTPACSIPAGGVGWRRTRQPVALEHWPVSSADTPERFTTVGSWRGPYGPIEHGGRLLGLKVHEFRKFIELPDRAPQTFEIALDIHPADEKDLIRLRRHGWRIVDPRTTVPDPDAFRRYVQHSGSEFSVAQGIYVETASGWFSDRTVRYLASGKPALVQDTGFSRNYPTGEGLVPFRTLEDAVDGADRIVRDYERHCRAARALAEEYFDARRVVGALVDDVGLAP